MMFKRRSFLILLACLLFVLQIDVHAAEVGQTAKVQDVLLVYDNELLALAHENVAAIADILTYMGYSTRYSTINESKGILNKFTHIVYYHESNHIEQSFLIELSKLRNKIMVVGGGDTTDLLRILKLPFNCTSLESTRAQLSYSFDGEKQLSMFTKSQHVSLLTGAFAYSKGTIMTGNLSASLCVRSARFSNLAVFDSRSALLKAILTQQLALWKWPYENAPNSFAQYIVFDEVYPFYNTQKMMKVIDMMKKLGVPYAITVMPIYQNGEYPAMKHFCEVLRYAQANGAAIFLKAPITNTKKPILEDTNKRISIAFSAYCSYGVYPIALEAPNNWLHEKLGQDILRRFRTIVLIPDQKENSWSVKDSYNTIHSDGHQIIAPALTVGDIEDNLINAYSTALFLNIDTDINDLQALIKKIQKSKVSLKNLWASSHSVYTQDKVLSYKDNILTINGEVQALDFTPFKYDMTYQYNRGIIGRMTDSFNRENKRLLFIVCGISILFIIFIGIARYQNRKKFLYNSDSDEDLGEEDRK
ncbi:MAG: DUF2334 domain-containing protein [Ruminiclostridium sp.]